MISLDGSVLLRLFVVDDEDQRRRARSFVGDATRNDPWLVNPIVLAEFAWVLTRRARLPRSEVARLIGAVLSADDLEIAHRAAAARALVSCARGKADFPDYFLAEINVDLGAAATVTFDGGALDSGSFSAVP